MSPFLNSYMKLNSEGVESHKGFQVLSCCNDLQVNGMSVITNSTLGITDPDTVFAVPSACDGVLIQTIPVGQARDVYNSVLSYVVSVI